jgi:hypothetical protein
VDEDILMRSLALIFLAATIGSAACTAAIGLDDYHLTSGSGGSGGRSTSTSSGGAGGTGGATTGSTTSTSSSGGSGGAVSCTTDAECNPGKKVIGFCFTPICNMVLGVCENTVKNGVPVPVQTPGDCHSVLCVDGDETDTVDSNDVPVDNVECTSDVCVAGVPGNPLVQPGTPCGAPGSTCDSKGNCGLLAMNGSPCSAPSGCASNVCTDGVCCDVACSGLCKACVAAKTGVPSGKCASITGGTDPDDECAGVITCNGSGACGGGGLLANGAVCVNGSQCVSTACADGVCCNTTCTGVCKACVAAKTGDVDGHCKDILDFTDPDNECPGVSVCDGAVCN